MKKTKKSQNELVKGLKATPFSQLNDRLPLKFEQINENNDLCKLLLKDPLNMTIQERAYINSFDDKEFKRFTEFLKLKAKEQQFIGNELGSGHYNERYISTLRDVDRENDRYGSLRKYLFLNYSKMKKDDNDDDKLGKTHNKFQEENFSGDVILIFK